MAKKIMMSPEQKALSKGLNPAARMWLANCVQKNVSIEQKEIKDFSNLEGRIYRLWLNQIIKNLKKTNIDKVLEAWISRLNKNIDMPGVNRITRDARREYIKKHDENLGKLVSLLSVFEQDAKKAKKIIFDALCNGDDFDTAIDKGNESNKLSLVAAEEKLYLKQTLRYLASILSYGETPRISTITQALNPEFCNDIDLFLEQVELLNEIYGRGLLTDEIKQLSFVFIKEATIKHGLFSNRILDYLCKGDWISEATYNLLKDVEPVITTVGMNPMVIKHLRDLMPNLKPKTVSFYFVQELLDLYKY